MRSADDSSKLWGHVLVTCPHNFYELKPVGTKPFKVKTKTGGSRPTGFIFL